MRWSSLFGPAMHRQFNPDRDRGLLEQRKIRQKQLMRRDARISSGNQVDAEGDWRVLQCGLICARTATWRSAGPWTDKMSSDA